MATFVTVLRRKNHLILFPRVTSEGTEECLKPSMQKHEHVRSSAGLDEEDRVDTVELRCVTFSRLVTQKVVQILEQHATQLRSVIFSSCERFHHRGSLAAIDAHANAAGRGRNSHHDIDNQCLIDLYAALSRTSVTSLKIIGSSAMLFQAYDASSADARLFRNQQQAFQRLLTSNIQELVISLPEGRYVERFQDYCTESFRQTGHDMFPFSHLLDGIAFSTTLRMLSICCGDFIRDERTNHETYPDCVTQRIVDAFRRNASLEVLEFKFTGLSDDLFGAICQSLQHHPRLHTINLTGNHCAHQTFNGLAKLLRSGDGKRDGTEVPSTSSSPSSSTDEHPRPGPAIRSLDLSNPQIVASSTNDAILQASFRAFFDALETNTTLANLRMTGFNLSDESECLAPLARVLSHNSILRRLDISSCGVTDVGIRVISAALKASQHTRLEELNLKFNRLKTSKALRSLLDMLQRNMDLTTIHLDRPRASADMDPALALEVKYWTMLNRYGRRLICASWPPSSSLSSSCTPAPSHIPPGLWPHIFHRVDRDSDDGNSCNCRDAHSSDDVTTAPNGSKQGAPFQHHVIYYFLRNQPTLFHSAN